MIIVMKPGASREQTDHVIDYLERLGLGVHLSEGVERTVIGAIGDESRINKSNLEVLDGVEKVLPILKPFKLVSREFRSENSIVDVGGVPFGGEEIPVIAGPCSVENRDQIMATAEAVKKAGARLLRGGAFKPRTSPYSFQGLEEEGLKLLAEAGKEFDLPIVTEVMSPDAVDLVAEYADMLQIGARNMQNYNLLRAVGRSGKPVLLKRGIAATIEEWLMAAEYILAEGNFNVVLCERGIRTYETATRFTLDLNAVPVVKELSHLPIVVDPSHGTGKWSLVEPMSLAGIAAGADGLIIEVHPRPEEALSDGAQSLKPKHFQRLMESAAAVARAVGRHLAPVAAQQG